mmetsp:Transcript_10156/g.16963  ORF Transcript_10156/g.16963 Transcript_10156/m.16963 type:complete len:804 (-) Transcript_10156:294-2705(-)
MSEFGKKEIYVLYGSQTGNAESLAEDFSASLSEEGIDNKCMNLNAAKKIPLKEVATLLIIICSTTGNGDAPENAEAWWRSVKLRSAAKDLFQDVPFSVLGLGDTNYDKFCHMGKSIDKRLGELGGKRILDLHCADEGTGMEETVEKWKKSVEIALTAEMESNGGEKQIEISEVEVEVGASEKSKEELDDGNVCSTGSNTSNLCNATSAIDPEVSIGLTELPAGILSLRQLIEQRNIVAPDAVVGAPSSTKLPRAKTCSAASCPYVFVEKEEEAIMANTSMSSSSSSSNTTSSSSRTAVEESKGLGEGCPDGGWTVETPYEAKVLDAKWLTDKSAEATIGEYAGRLPWGTSRNVIQLDISIAGSGIAYSPGDSIGICCPNPPHLVAVVLQRLQQAHFDREIRESTMVKTACGTHVMTLHDMLSHKFDLTGPPKKAAMATLAQCCTDPEDMLLMQHLCSRGDTGKRLWESFVEQQRLGLAELLSLVPSCTPQLHQLVACMTCLPPRYYSIASSPLVDPNRIVVAFSTVRYTCGGGGSSSSSESGSGQDNDNKQELPLIQRAGICTSYLEQQLKHFLFPCYAQQPAAAVATSSASAPLLLRVFHKVTINFHLPGSVAPPLVLIGPGTGVSPFIGFLEHRAHLEKNRRGGNEDCCMGMWRGGYELEEEDLPSEYCAGVAKFIKSVQSGPIHLFFGCRTQQDYLFREKLQGFLEQTTLSTLEVAMSRVTAEKVYVTHRIRARAAELAQMILEQGAHIYICGDGNHMAKDVNLAIKQALCEHGNMTEDGADSFLQEMRQRRRYVLDIWS